MKTHQAWLRRKEQEVDRSEQENGKRPIAFGTYFLVLLVWLSLIACVYYNREEFSKVWYVYFKS